MGFRETVFGGKDEVKFEGIPQSPEATEARRRLSEISEGPLPEIPLRQIAPVQPLGEERTLARDTAKELIQPQDFFQLPEVQGIIRETKEAGDLLSNRLLRVLQKSGSLTSTPGRDILGRSTTDVEQRIASSLAPFAAEERARRTGLIPTLENLGATREGELRGVEQAELSAIFEKETIESRQIQDFLLPLLRSIIQLQPGQASFIQEPLPGLIEQIGLIASIIPEKKGTE